MLNAENDGVLVEPSDWEHVLDGFEIPDDLTFVNDDSPESGSLESLEHFLMNDDYFGDHHHSDQLADEFFADVFVDSPVEDCSPKRIKDSCDEKANGSSSERVNDSSDEKAADSSSSQKAADASFSENANDVPLLKEGDSAKDDFVVEQDENDPMIKKRKRQLRNREAAVQSRERKKMYVRDLEIKSKYFEAECRRLGMLLQCCLAENNALRFSLHNSKAVDASITKQESAVLLLESLLLGSLLWFLGIICLFILPPQPQSTRGVVQPDHVDRGSWASLDLGKGRSNILRILEVGSRMMGKRCKAARSRMKLIPFVLPVKV